jgi:hypothetical protein
LFPPYTIVGIVAYINNATGRKPKMNKRHAGGIKSAMDNLDRIMLARSNRVSELKATFYSWHASQEIGGRADMCADIENARDSGHREDSPEYWEVAINSMTMHDD